MKTCMNKSNLWTFDPYIELDWEFSIFNLVKVFLGQDGIPFKRHQEIIWRRGGVPVYVWQINLRRSHELNEKMLLHATLCYV